MTEGRGIFPPGTARHGPPSAKRAEAHRRLLHQAREKRIVQLAEHVADGWSVAAAARHLGVSQQTGSAMWRDICERVGWQAI